MSALYSAKELRICEKKTPGTIESDDVRPTIVTVGDFIPDADVLDSFLERKGISHYSRETLTELEKRPAKSADLVIVNLERLTFDAHKKIQSVKSKYRVPIVCLAPVEDADKVGLVDSLGADDYLFKPFNLEELVCRISILLRRHGIHNRAPCIERRAQFRRKADQNKLHKIAGPNRSEVQIDNHKKLVRLGDRAIALTPKEYKLFCLLASEPGRVFSIDEIIDHLWKNRQRASATDVQQYIYLLRKKVELDIQQPQWVITAKGFGYLLNVANA